MRSVFLMILLLQSLISWSQSNPERVTVEVTVVGDYKDDEGDNAIKEQVYYGVYSSTMAEGFKKDYPTDKKDDAVRTKKYHELHTTYLKYKSDRAGVIRDLQINKETDALVVMDGEETGYAVFHFNKANADPDGVYHMTIQTPRIKEVVSRAKYKGEGKATGIGTSTPEYEIWKISIRLDKGEAKPTSRLIIQPFAVELNTGDTVDYLTPIVYEGEAYHAIQDKRMDYNFLKNDKLGHCYKRDYILTDTAEMVINETIKYKKRKRDIEKKTKFKASVFTYTLEDYHHVYVNQHYPGEFPQDPLKFIDFSVAMDSLDLTDKYFEVEAAVNRIDAAMSLALRFERNSAVLIRDSLNEVQKEKLIKELQMHPNLERITLSAGASPEGTDAGNEKVAMERAKVAIREIQPYLARGLYVTPERIVYTWNHVVDSLEKKGMAAEAKEVRAIVEREKSQDAMDKPIADLPFYEEKIVPILESMRNMICSYSYVDNRPMSLNEVYSKFRYFKETNNLDSLLTFSNGDFYNLYTIADSAEQEIVTDYAYKKITSSKNYEDIPFSAYVANRKAMLMNKMGTPDSTILKPFIYEDDSVIVFNYIRSVGNLPIRMNMVGIWLNQAITFLQLGDFYRATQFSRQLSNSSKVVSDKVEGLVSVIDFKDLLPKENELNAEEDVKYGKAKEYVLNSNKDNRAILYTEMTEWNMRDKAPALVGLMEDDNPKKWYLRGILYADSLNKRVSIDDLVEKPAVVVPGFEDFRELNDVELEKLRSDELTLYMNRLKEYNEAKKLVMPEEKSQSTKKSEYIPYYLAYFQHCFDLDPSYVNYYLTEGHVPVKTRKIYKYKLKHVDLYRRIFEDYLKPLEQKRTYTEDSVSHADKAEITQPETDVSSEMPESDNVPEEINNDD